MEAGAILLLFGLVLLSGSALAAFCWAARDGQLENLDRAPEVIFDEPEAGDRFPGSTAPDAAARR